MFYLKGGCVSNCTFLTAKLAVLLDGFGFQAVEFPGCVEFKRPGVGLIVRAEVNDFKGTGLWVLSVQMRTADRSYPDMSIFSLDQLEYFVRLVGDQRVTRLHLKTSKDTKGAA